MFLISLIALYVITITFFGIVNQDLNSHVSSTNKFTKLDCNKLMVIKKIIISIMQYLTIFNCQLKTQISNNKNAKFQNNTNYRKKNNTK